MAGYYDSYYRLYCRVTHSAFGAMVGGRDSIDFEDIPTVASCVLGALHGLKSRIGVDVPKLSEFEKRLVQLKQSPASGH